MSNLPDLSRYDVVFDYDPQYFQEGDELAVLNPIAALAKLLGKSTKEAEAIYLAQQAAKFSTRKPVASITGNVPTVNPFAKYMTPDGATPLQLKQAEVEARMAEQAAMEAEDLKKLQMDARKRHVADSLANYSTRHWALEDDDVPLIPYKRR